MIILRGAGRAFCAGYDLTEDAAGGVLDARHWHEDLSHSTAAMLEILDNPKPVIAQVHSYCLAGGTDLMLACDLAVAADDAYFGYVDVRFGSGVVSMFLPWVVGVRKAKELLFTGEDRVPADEALRIGLVNRVVPREQLDAATLALAEEIAKNEPFVVQTTKRAVEPRVGRRRVPRGDGGEHGARRDDRDREPPRSRRVPPDHAGAGPEGRDRVAGREVPGETRDRAGTSARCWRLARSRSSARPSRPTAGRRRSSVRCVTSASRASCIPSTRSTTRCGAGRAGLR